MDQIHALHAHAFEGIIEAERLVRSRAPRSFFLPNSSFLLLPIGGRRFDGEPRPPRQGQEVFISRHEDSRASAVSEIEKRLICQIAADDGALPHPVNRLAVHEGTRRGSPGAPEPKAETLGTRARASTPLPWRGTRVAYSRLQPSAGAATTDAPF